MLWSLLLPAPPRTSHPNVHAVASSASTQHRGFVHAHSAPRRAREAEAVSGLGAEPWFDSGDSFGYAANSLLRL